jgi:signal peptidase I
MNEITTVKLNLVLSQLTAGLPVKVKANGFSMTPVIRNGVVLTLQRIDPGRLKAGDIVAFLNDGTIYIHRLLSIDTVSDRLLTKGDNLEYSDKLLTTEEIIAIITHIDEQSLSKNSFLTKSLFRIYLFALLFRNSQNEYENGKIARILLSQGRFRITKFILRIYACPFRFV